jgi:hypothetical protein
MKGMAVEQVLLIFLCVAVAIGILIWYWQTYAKGLTVFSQSECQQAITLRCYEWKARDYLLNMRARFFCKNNMPEACRCNDAGAIDIIDSGPVKDEDGYHELVFNVFDGAWWNCIAPGCKESYGLKIETQTDCPLAL